MIRRNSLAAFALVILIIPCITSFSLLHLVPSGQITATVVVSSSRQRSILAASASSTERTSASDISDLVSYAKQQGLDKYFAFPLDDWQLQAGGAILRGDNVIVCAPTGAGKTVVGEMALLHAFYNLKQTGIYTTPLKALSNQKYADLSRIFGRSNTGLSTGDVSVNRNARITVMTTEVYRNIAWRSSSTPSPPSNDQVTRNSSNNSSSKNELSKNAIVVLDEFHYMGYTGRGGVWEECVITSPSHTQIIGLSATLANGAALASWMESVTNRRTVLVDVPGQERPVPLRYLFATKEGLFPLFRDPDAGPGSPKGLLGYRNDGQPDNAAIAGADIKSKKKKNKPAVGFQKAPTKEEMLKLPTGLQVNPELRAAARRQLQRVDRAFERQKARRSLSIFDEDQDDYNSDRFGRGRGRGGNNNKREPPSNAVYQSPRKLSPREERREKERLMRNEMRRMVPSLSALLSRLRQKELLPAIFFIFSRARCDEAARTVCQTMMGPDPNRLLDHDDDDEFGNRPSSSSSSSSSSKKRKTPPRQQRGGFVEDNNGRTFRSKSNYLSENVVNSLFENDDDDSSTSPDVDDDGSFEYYTKAGLLNMKEVQEVMSRVSRFNQDNPEIAFDDNIMEQYLFGVGSHHAGMLPAHKTFVEALYRDQLMKAVFATETLAAGINMPARTTVVCALAKRGDGSSMNLLQTSTLLQMAGRAGRRGFDTSGTCVIVATPFESHEDAAKILTDPLLPIRSQFKPSYSLSVNLLARGEGNLDVARQLVRKSFAMWERREAKEKISDAVQRHGDGVSEVVQYSSQHRFINILIDTMQLQIERRLAKFDIARLQSLLNIWNDREVLKQTSKAYMAIAQALELEETTLGYLETEFQTMMALKISDEMDMLADEADLLEQIEIQQNRILKLQKELQRHPYSALARIANEIMSSETDDSRQQAVTLRAALRNARAGGGGDGDEQRQHVPLTASELSEFSKSAVIVQRKTRKLAQLTQMAMGGGDDDDANDEDSWNDLLAIIKVLVAYGCLKKESTNDNNDGNNMWSDMEDATFTVTDAGQNIANIGFDNSLWALVSLGGAWDVIGASSELDRFREQTMKSFGDNRADESSWYGDDDGDEMSSISSSIAIGRSNDDDKRKSAPTVAIKSLASKSQQEASKLVSLLRRMTPPEFAGYVSAIVSEGPSIGMSIIDVYDELTPLQQQVMEQALLAMERLGRVQQSYNVDATTRACHLDIQNLPVVTAWTNGCTWNEAMRISGQPPGDLARTLSRVLDAVRQFGNLPFTPLRKQDLMQQDEDGGSSIPLEVVCRGIHPDVRRLCREAAQGLNRYPVKDNLAMEGIDEEEVEEEDFEDVDNVDKEGNEDQSSDDES